MRVRTFLTVQQNLHQVTHTFELLDSDRDLPGASSSISPRLHEAASPGTTSSSSAPDPLLAHLEPDDTADALSPSNRRNLLQVQPIMNDPEYNPLANPITAQCNVCDARDLPSYIFCQNPECGVAICSRCLAKGDTCRCPASVTKMQRIVELTGHNEAQGYTIVPFSLASDPTPSASTSSVHHTGWWSPN